MRIAIAHWQGRVSPVFDVSDQLFLIDIENGREQMRQGIHVTGFICGNLEPVIAAFMSGKLSDSRFLMPGSRRKYKSPDSLQRCRPKRPPAAAQDRSLLPSMPNRESGVDSGGIEPHR